MKVSVSAIAFLISLLSLLSCEGNSDSIHISDEVFLKALIEAEVDKNGDGAISFREAQRVESLNLGPGKISDLTGVESFVNLDTLIIHRNPLDSVTFSGNSALRFLQLTGCGLTQLNTESLSNLTYLNCSGMTASPSYLQELDLRNNRNLEVLHCEENQLEQIDVTQCVELRELGCGYNQLEDLNLSGNTALTYFTCNNNRFQQLDITHNEALNVLITCGNLLPFLDVSYNRQLSKLGIDNMPMLKRVCVWAVPFPPAGLTVLMEYSPNVVFETGC